MLYKSIGLKCKSYNYSYMGCAYKPLHVTSTVEVATVLSVK